MRPIKLVMSAFGPYGEIQEIDFKNLGDKNIFVITGPTGAGKTTIFDAITYALYGQASGTGRDGENLRSDFAKEDCLTYVELYFELKGKNYYVKRIPKQKKKKIRGEGFTIQDTEAELKVEEGKIITGANNVSLKILEIMGINYEQFKQIVMIPQGEFRELLLSDSKDRELIFRKIFGTYAFQKIQDKLDDKAKNLYKGIYSLREHRSANIKSIDWNGDSELKSLTASKDLNILEIINKVNELIDRDKEEEDRLKKLMKASEEQISSFQNSIFISQQNNKKLEEKNQLQSYQKELLEKKDEFENKKSYAAKGRKALVVKGAEDYYLSRKNALKVKQEEVRFTKQNIEILKTNLEKSRDLLSVQQGKEGERKKVNEELIKLKGYIDKVKNYEKNIEKVILLKEDLKSRNIEKTNKKALIEKLKNTIKDLNQSLESLKNSEAEYIRTQKELENKYNAYKKLYRLYEENNILIQLREDYKRKREIFIKEDSEFKLQKSKYDTMHDLFLKGQAGILAEGLREEEPCPVCGSKHHPNPAVSLKGIPSEESLKKEKDTYENLERNYNLSIEELTTLKTKGEAQKKVVDDLKCEIGEQIEENMEHLEKDSLTEFINNFSKILKDQIEELKIKLLILEKNQEKYKINSKELKDSMEILEREEKELYRLEEDYTILYGKLQSGEQELKLVEEELPKTIRTLKDLMYEIDKVNAIYENMEKEYLNAVETYRKIEMDYNSALVNIKGKEEAENYAHKELCEAEKMFKDELKKADFNDEQEYINAKTQEEEILKLEKEIADYNEKIKSVEDRFHRIEKEVENINFVDLNLMEEELKKVKDERYKTEITCKEIYARIKHNVDLLDNINKVNSRLEKEEEKYRVVGELARSAKGDNSERISFERYVLASYFDDIIEAANIRLAKMTTGRYEMSRIKEKVKGNAQQGLELEVYDNYTGKYRHVKTLSGGESFKASLSLALGLADVVQCYAGGINIDTMFIDEGFGTLDPESLDNAISCLIELQNTGRLVGIISHVPELKERIPVRLEITPGIEGSTAKFDVV